MGLLKEWALIICFAILFCTMLEMLCPCGKMEKMMKFILGAFVIYIIIVPSFKIVSNINFDSKFSYKSSSNTNEFIKDIETQEKEVISVKIRDIVMEKLNSINIKPEKIDVFMDTKDKNSISINKIKVFITKEDSNKYKEVKNLIEKELGINTEIVF